MQHDSEVPRMEQQLLDIQTGLTMASWSHCIIVFSGNTLIGVELQKPNEKLVNTKVKTQMRTEMHM